MSLKEVINVEDVETIDVEKDIFETNKRLAEENRKIFEKNGIRAFEFMGSVGTGKTSLIDNLVEKLKENYSIAVINGDLATTIDADIIGKHGINVIQINTGRECHLEAHIINKVLDRLDLEKTDLIFIENVGNLICPSDFKLGVEKRVVVISVTEGQYVVVKHPLAFLETDMVVINKVDLTETMEVNLEKLEDEIKHINPRIKTVRTNCKDGTGIESLIKLLSL